MRAPFSPASLSLLALAALVASCATYKEPVGYLDGRPFQRADPHLVPVVVTKVDGSSYPYSYAYSNGSASPVEAGEHVITVQAPLAKYAHIPTERDLKLKVEPCVRYTLGARRSSNLVEDFEPVVLEKEPMPGCNPNSR